MPYQASEINKALDEAFTSLSQLDQALASCRGSDVDYLPNSTTQKAYAALERLSAMLKGGENVKELRGRGNVLDVMAKLSPKLDRPEVQTMLGSAAVEFFGMLRNVQQVLREKDTKRVEGTGFEGLRKQS